MNRRSLFRAASGVTATSFWADETIEAYQNHINTNSKPSDLKITDLRVAVITKAPMTCPMIQIDTNQGIYGLGEVRDGASKTYALMLKSRLLGENPCNVDKVFRKIKQFGGQSGRRAVCAASRWLFGIRGQTPITCLCTRCSGGSFAIRSAATRILRNPRILRSMERGFARARPGFHLVEDGFGN